ncbi:MAG: hypothetical protein Q9169_004926 [Polycauliona sp. 2 TL-2023]
MHVFRLYTLPVVKKCLTTHFATDRLSITPRFNILTATSLSMSPKPAMAHSFYTFFISSPAVMLRPLPLLVRILVPIHVHEKLRGWLQKNGDHVHCGVRVPQPCEHPVEDNDYVRANTGQTARPNSVIEGSALIFKLFFWRFPIGVPNCPHRPLYEISYTRPSMDYRMKDTKQPKALKAINEE